MTADSDGDGIDDPEEIVFLEMLPDSIPGETGYDYFLVPRLMFPQTASFSCWVREILWIAPPTVE